MTSAQFEVLDVAARSGAVTERIDPLRHRVYAYGLTLSMFTYRGETEVAPLVDDRLPDWGDPLRLPDAEAAKAFMAAWLDAAFCGRSPRGTRAWTRGTRCLRRRR
jgi:hypothetical protein